MKSGYLFHTMSYTVFRQDLPTRIRVDPDFFEANAANPEDMPQFEFEDMLQRELQWPE